MQPKYNYSAPADKTFDPIKLSDGTTLPLLNLRGKPYLQVAHRLVWFRKEHPNWTILTEIHTLADKGVIMRATIKNGETVIATAHKKETQTNFADYIEKAETGAIGRALGMCGYGTQYEPEFDEGERLADAPTIPARKTPLKIEQEKLDALADMTGGEL